MTQAKIRELVRIWQKRLKLDRQAVTLIFVDECPYEGDELCLAETKPNKNYDRARIWFYLDQLEKYDDDEVEVTVIHELLHVAHKGIEKCIGLLDNVLTNDSLAVYEAAFDMHNERFIDRLAWALFDLVHTD